MSRQDQIRANKRNQFQQRRQVNQLYAQRLQSGEFGNAKDGYDFAGAATQPYVVKDGDTLETISAASGGNPNNILNNNPDMRNLQTGMVINVPGSEAWRAQGYGGMSPGPAAPIPGSEAWRAQGYGGMSGGIGLPSNAALGGTTSNPQGNNPFNVNQPGAFGSNQPGANGLRVTQPAPQGGGFLDWVKGLGQNVPVGGTPSPYQTYKPPSNSTWSQQPVAAAIQATTPKTNTSTPPAGFYQSQYQYMSRNLFHQQIRTKVDTAGYMPTPGELNILETMGFIKKDKTASGGGGGYRRGRGGGGGGRGKNPGLGGGGVPREPAFAGGSGFGGLVNWRI
jgi:LysM repeat protein